MAFSSTKPPSKPWSYKGQDKGALLKRGIIVQTTMQSNLTKRALKCAPCDCRLVIGGCLKQRPFTKNCKSHHVDTKTVYTVDSLFRSMNECVCILVQMIVDPKARPETIVFECSRSKSTSGKFSIIGSPRNII